MKTQRQAIHKKLFVSALNATAKKRASLVALQDKGKILMTIKSDPIMKQRWDRYCKENYYAKGIDFDEVIEVLVGIVN